MEADEKACPFCAETIKAAAIKCKHCGEMMTPEVPTGDQPTVPLPRKLPRGTVREIPDPHSGACPRCGGTQFKVQRKTSTKLMFGLASMLGNARWVRCVKCGTRYRRA